MPVNGGSCAAPAEGRFVDAVSRILVLEARALATADPFRQAELLAEVAELKHEAKMALHFALTECARLYPLPPFFAVLDDNGNIVEIRRFTVGGYHAYLVERYLETGK